MADDDGYSLASEKKDGKRITRSTVNRAIKALVGYKWVEQLGNGMIQLNVRLWFHGNSNAQHAVQHDRDPEAFPNGIGPDVHQEELDLDFTENPH
ncbi:hypothetical protein [Streptomyces sp. NPDC006355]|uniref:hypothetical protein n=1 Tax=Streptomyces sp. NPDC006355 TaxID=3156758 RepID=UPI0033AF5E8F